MVQAATGYNGNANLPKAGTIYSMTADQIDEYRKCMASPSYFAENYFKIVTLDNGLQLIKLYDFQKEASDAYLDTNKLLMATSRQIGKTTIATVIILHYVLFNEYKSVFVLANKAATAQEVLSRVQLAYEYLPHWLKCGVVEWNKMSVEFENGSKVTAAATSSDAIRGKSANMLYIDEQAFVQNWDEFSASVLPVISSGKTSKLIFTSTPKGLNHFYEYVEGARKGINGFKLIEVKWDDVPGRDEKWKEATLATLNNDLERFAQEFCVSFLGSSDNLISGAAMKNIKADALQYKPIRTNISYGYRIYEEPVRDKIYAMTCDVSRGKGLDYSTFHVIDITQIPYKQVATFRNNLITPTDFAAFIYNTAKAYNEAYTLIEINDIGGQVADILYFDYGYENLISTESAGTKGKRVSAGYGRNVDRGIRTTITVKALGCSMLKLLIEQRKLTIYDVETINELSSFVKKGKSYEAEPGKHDDLVMALVLFAWLTTDTFFKNINDLDVMHTLRDLSDEQIFDELVPFGIISTYDMPQEEPRVEKIGNELWSVEDYGPDNMGSF